MKIFDSHTHLNDEHLYPEADKYFKHAQSLGVVKIANVGSNQKLNDLSLELSAKYADMYSIIGWHPEDSIYYHEEQEKLLIEQLQSPKVVGLGEIGLDYHQTTAPRVVQKRVFKRQIDIAKQLHLPISVHNRDAFEDTYAILKEMNVSDIRGVMHSFNGDSEWLKKFLDLGMLVSYSGVASFKKTHEVHDAVRNTPFDSMMVETDAPYLSPEPLRGKQNEPAYSLYTVEALARICDVNPDVIAAHTYENTMRLFGIEE
ncbi:TatD family hydrolase [Lentilactobacillus kefiri]|uniref:TatD family hydrolase n=3 Tax=Lactobacillales TaxID=186826 RepID=A0A8E1V1G6_LENKE|nr:TatD family hydrolase [Lentilactobacillus kefiri]KRL53575.1 TatD family hydrolase [Lentilactobacillus parakefiri DSM 10551]KRM50509.1 TatD family hydrolase [Lentilactobacillus kefiri DSM 20587 = JCM 5818]MCJ2161543.1 TatD family hydrolase [Lentilactobacillus kefiri]MCP9369004.1 TatD family hydrolase [Lentilactobacillus kefiri]MDH5108299.1 TatD family hydrolase [Lentilactobacillus kefiri]